MLNLNPIELTLKQIEIIKSFGELKAEYWGKHKIRLKDAIRKELESNQNGECVYCGCKVHETGDVEHIAHKAAYPQFLFTPKNLAFSCRLCNEDIKGSKNTIDTLADQYDRCTFVIVHPYLDDVDIYFDQSKPLITIRKGLSEKNKTKAMKTIELLQFNSTKITERRAEYIMAMNYGKIIGKSISEVAIENALEYIPNRSNHVY